MYNKLYSAFIGKNNKINENVVGWLMASPWIFGFCCFMLGPIIVSIYVSFTNYSLLAPPKFIGAANYTKMFFQDTQVWKSMWITTYYSIVAVPLQLALGFILAFLLNRKIKGLSFFRTLFYLPTIISGVTVGLLWRQIFNPDFGILNYILNMVLGTGNIEWLNNEQLVIPSLILVSLWGVGRTMVVNLSGLQGIPTSLYESAEIDGCTSFKSIFYITIPMMTPIIFLNLVTGLIASFQTFTSAYITTGGGPDKASLFYMLYLYQNAFQNFRMGYASALSWLLFLYVLVLTFIVFKSSNYWVYYEGGDDQK